MTFLSNRRETVNVCVCENRASHAEVEIYSLPRNKKISMHFMLKHNGPAGTTTVLIYENLQLSIHGVYLRWKLHTFILKSFCLVC